MSSPNTLTITVDEAARRIGIGRNATYDLIRAGRLPHLRVGRVIRVPVRSLEEWVEAEAARRLS